MPIEFEAEAFWLRSPGEGEIRPVELPRPGAGEVLVRTLYSGVSRGTESIVFRGGVPESQHQAMRAPFQEGDFPGPVKYGYLNVGVVEEGPPALRRPHRLLPVPPSDKVRRPGGGGDAGARVGSARTCGAGRHRGDRGERAVGRCAAGR